MLHFEPYTLQECNDIYKELDFLWIVTGDYYALKTKGKVNYLFSIFSRVEATLYREINYECLRGVIDRATKEFENVITNVRQGLKGVDQDAIEPPIKSILRETELHLKKYSRAEYQHLYMFLSHYSLFIEYLERVNKLGIVTIKDLSVLDFIHYFFISRIKSLKNRLSEIPISPVKALEEV